MNTQILNKQKIYSILPHKYPIALLDEAVYDNPTNITCTFNVISDSELSKGHFATNPVVPGTYIAEAMAQAAALIMLESPDTHKIPYLMGISNMRFLSSASYGKTISVKAEMTSQIDNMADFKVSAYQADVRIATGALSLIVN